MPGKYQSRVRWCAHWLSLIAVLGASPAGAATGGVYPADSLVPAVRVEDILSSRSLEWFPVGLSSDGECVAYTVDDPLRRRLYRAPDTTAATYTSRWLLGTDVYVTNRRSGQTRRVIDGLGNSWAPVWSPDGTTLAYYADQGGTPRVWLWDRKSGYSHAIGDVSIRGLNDGQVLRWSPDSRTILVAIAPEALSTPAPRDTGDSRTGRDTALRSTVTVYRATPLGDVGRAWPDTAPLYTRDRNARSRRTDLALIDVASGHVGRIVRDVAPAWYAFSADGHAIAFATDKGQVRDNNLRNGADLFLRAADGRVTPLAHGIRTAYYRVFQWSPDSKSIIYLQAGEAIPTEVYQASTIDRTVRRVGTLPQSVGDSVVFWLGAVGSGDAQQIYTIIAGALWVIDVSTQRAHEMVRIPRHRLIALLAPQQPAMPWMVPGTQVALFATLDDSTQRSGVCAIDLVTRRVRWLREDAATSAPDVASGFDISTDGRTFLFVSQDATHPRDLWVTDSSFRTRARVSDLNPWTRAQPLGESRSITWRSDDGMLLRGALLLPARYDPRRRYPLIVLVYAGGTGSGWWFGPANIFGLWPWLRVDNMQLLATRGYAVLLPSLPQHIGTPMFDIAKTLLPAIDRLIDLGIADPDRLGLMGQSYGGYTTLSAIVQTNRFKAAVVRAGPVDLIAEYGMMGADGSGFGIGLLEDGQGLMRGTPWQYRDRYIENSPVFYLDRVRTPVLIVHGAADNAVPVTEGDELFVDLRRLGNVEVEYARYAGEGHSLENYENQRDYLNRMLAWFGRHLQKAD